MSTWQPSGVRRVDYGVAPRVDFVLPGAPADPDLVVARPETCGGGVLFLGNTAHVHLPYPVVTRHGLFRADVDARGAIQVMRVGAGVVDGVSVDLFEHDGRCVAVTNEPTAGGRFWIAIYESPDRSTWRRRVRFESDVAARSGEWMGGYFYVGTGCDGDDCTRAAGRLLRVAVE